MGFLDSAQGVLDKGVSAAKGAVSGIAIDQRAFNKDFGRLCTDGYEQGWHERNGGNLSYRLTEDEVSSCQSFFYDEPSSWVPLGVRAENLGGECFLVTAAGAYMREVASNSGHSTGIVELNAEGDAWRTVWGFKDDRMPTSELPSHIALQAVRKQATQGASRVLYHAHPTATVALTHVLPLDSRSFTRALWKSFLESMVAFPQGIGVIPWMVPGGADIALASADAMQKYEACVWAHHGVFVAGTGFNEVFGLVQAIEKAASIYEQARAANGGSGEFLNEIPDEGLRGIAEAYGLSVNEEFLQ